VTEDPEASVERKQPERPLAPLREANDRLVTAVITAGWAVALVVLLILLAIPGALPPSQRWWLWVCATGVAMGLFGLWYVPMLQRNRARAAAQHGQSQQHGQAQQGKAQGMPLSAGDAPGPQSSDSGYDSLDSGSKTVSSTDTPGSSTRS
jgi:hypothetical protein